MRATKRTETGESGFAGAGEAGERPRILVIEDDATMREMIGYNLERGGYTTLLAMDGTEGCRIARIERPDLVLLDVMLPGTDGISLCRELRGSAKSMPIIMVTALAGEAERLEGFEAGADDYVTKPFSMEELLARVRANLRRAATPASSTGMSAGKTAFGDLEIDAGNREVKIDGKVVHFRTKEFELLALLASAPGKLFTRQEITERTWGSDFIGDSRTIDVHIKNIRQNLAERSEYEFIETVRGSGYRFRMRPRQD